MLAGRVWERDCMGQDEGGDLSGGSFLSRGSFGLGVKSSSRDGGPARLCRGRDCCSRGTLWPR
jgi:hypothetical protein